MAKGHRTTCDRASRVPSSMRRVSSGKTSSTDARMDLSVSIGPLRLKNPVIAASGCFGYGVEYAEMVDLSTLGAIVVKGLFLTEREGHPPPRIVETPSG